MSKIEITRDLIVSIANQDRSKFVKSVGEKVNGLLAESVKALSEKVSYISLDNIILQPVNEVFNNSFIDNSSLTYFLGIENAQLEINSARKLNFWKNFKQRLKYAWENRNGTKKKKRRWFRRKRKEEVNIAKINFDPTKYSMFQLAEDLQNTMINYLSETSLVELKDTYLRIIGRDDFGSTSSIVVYLVSYSNGSYKYFSPKNRGFTMVNINSRLEHVNKKISAVGKDFTKMLKIFNTLYYNINGHTPNQIYIESVLCACPDELFEGDDIYKTYLKIINFLAIKTIKNIKSINDLTKNINEDPVCGKGSGMYFNRMLNSIS